jgi:hypothetical protein
VCVRALGCRGGQPLRLRCQCSVSSRWSGSSIAARGSTPTGSGDTRWSALTSLLDLVVSFAVVGFVISAVISIYVLIHGDRSISHERSGFGIMYAFLFVAVATAIARHFSLGATPPRSTGSARGRPQPPHIGSGRHHYEPPHVLWLPVVAAVALIGVAVATALISDRRRRRSLSSGSSRPERRTWPRALRRKCVFTRPKKRTPLDEPAIAGEEDDRGADLEEHGHKYVV